jgi:hypothetical protein
MNTSITSFARLARLARGARRVRAYSLPVLVAGALAAGCGTATVNPGGANEPANGASPSAPASASASASGSAPGSVSGSAASAKPLPIDPGGPMIPGGGAACTGWPTNATHGTLTAFFTPVAVERCVTSFQQIAGKGEWETATLEKSTDKLAALTAVLMRPSSGHQPDIMCPEFALIPPQIVLISATGKELIPKLPVGACGTLNAQLLTTLATMTWQTVSVRLVTRVTPTAVPKTLPGASLAPGSPKVLRTGSPDGLENGKPVSSTTH